MFSIQRGCPGSLAAAAVLFVCFVSGAAFSIADPPAHPALLLSHPGRESALTEGLPTMGSYDSRTALLSDGANLVVAVTLEDFQLKAARSTDGGVNFSPEVVIGGAPSGHLVHHFDIAHGPGGADYLLLLVADPQGGLGLEVMKTTDHGFTWSAARPALQWSSAVFGANFENSVLGAGAGGRLAILFVHPLSGDPFVISSADDGLFWSAAVRVDPQLNPGTAVIRPGGIAVGADGTIHAVYSNFLSASDNSTVYYTRSVDGGLTFSAPRTFNDLLPSLPPESVHQDYPEVACLADGSLVVAFSHAARDPGTLLWPGELAVVRSSDQGLSFSLSTLALLGADDGGNAYQAGIWQHPVTGTALVGAANRLLLRPFWVLRSTDSGASFSAPLEIPGLSAASPGKLLAVAAGPPDRWSAGVRSLVSLSRDDGLTWENAQTTSGILRPDQLAFAAGDHLITAAITTPTGQENGAYLRRTPADPFNLSVPDQRVDQDRSMVPVGQGSFMTLGSDGLHQAYAALSVTPGGLPTQVYVTPIADGGRSVDVPVLVSTNFGNVLGPSLTVKGLEGGQVYLAFLSNNSYAVRFNRSLDFGITWQPADLVLASTNILRSELKLEADSTGRVVITWLENQHLAMVRSNDWGATFTIPVFIDQSSQVLANSHSLCAGGGMFFIAYRDNSCEGQACYLWERHSDDGGASWSPRKGMVEDPAAALQMFIALSCNSEGDAALGWVSDNPDSGQFTDSYVRRFRSADWDPAVLTHRYPAAIPGQQLLFSQPENLLVLAGDGKSVWSQRSADGGSTFADPVTLDATTPLPGVVSGFFSPTNPRAAADSSGRIWASWLEASPSGISNYGAIAVTTSGDGGATWSPVERVNEDLPQGGRGNTAVAAAALPGAGLFAVWAQRESFNRWWIVASHEVNDGDGDGVIDRRDNCLDAANPFQTDGDGDGVGYACDCDDADAGRTPAVHEDCDDGIDNNCNQWMDGVDPECSFTGERLVDFAPIHGMTEAGYFHDTGEPFVEDRGYGWLLPAGNRLNTRARFCPGVPLKQRSLALAEEAVTWELELPAGDYAVSVGVGDCAMARGPQFVTVEGIVAVNGETTAAGETLVREVNARVLDGKLTVQAGGGGGVTALQYLTARVGLSSLRVNFQEQSSPIPEGYSADWGLPKEKFRRFGWSASLVGSGVERGLHPDQRLDTLLLVSDGPYSWEAEVGRQYQTVTVSVGDPLLPQGPHWVTVMGVPLFSGETTAAGEFLQRAVEVAVPDGHFSMTVGSPAGVTAINYIDLVAFGSGEVCDQLDNDGNGGVDDGCDQDSDGYCNQAKLVHPMHRACPYGINDCDDTAGEVWALPGEVRNLAIFDDNATLMWSRPLSAGGLWSAVVYDTIRSGGARGFESAGVCVEADDGSDRVASDYDNPAAGEGFFYLVRAENSCPAGMGPLGPWSDGTARQARPCP